MCVSDTCLNQEFISYHVPTGRVGWITPLIWEIQYSLCFVRVCYSRRSCFSLNHRCLLTETKKIVREITAEWAVCDIFCQYFSIWCRKTMENSNKKKAVWREVAWRQQPTEAYIGHDTVPPISQLMLSSFYATNLPHFLWYTGKIGNDNIKRKQKKGRREAQWDFVNAYPCCLNCAMASPRDILSVYWSLIDF